MKSNNKISINKLENGLTVIINEVKYVTSVSYDLSFKGGITNDPIGKIGASLALSDYVTRGAGNLNAVELSNAFDNEGIVHNEYNTSDKFHFKGSLLPEQLPKAFELIRTIITEPHLKEEDLDPIKTLLLMEIESIKDRPSSMVMNALNERYYPQPLNRRSVGYEKDIQSLTKDDALKVWETTINANDAILSVCGNIDTDAVLALTKKFFADLPKKESKDITLAPFPKHIYEHIEHDSNQLQIALATAAPLFLSSDYYIGKVASSIMSNSMFGRLFIEVREKRGLVYSVMSRYSCGKNYGVIIGYAGTTTERAQETLDIFLNVMRTAKGTVESDELNRAKIGIKSSLALSEESMSSKSSSNLSDYWLAGRVRSVEEIFKEIDSVSIEDIDKYFDKWSLDSFTLVTLGKKRLEVK